MDRLVLYFFGLKKVFRKLGNYVRVVCFAAKHIQVSRIRLVGKMGGNERRLYKLRHGVSGHPLVFSEMDHLSFPKALHLDKIAKLNNKLFDRFCIPDGLGIAIIKVYT